MRNVSFKACTAIRDVTIVKRSIENSKDDLTDVVSSMASKHIQRMTIGFVNRVTDARLRSEIASKTWGEFDDAITRLAEQTLNDGQRLRLELHFCGSPEVELFYLLFPGFIKIGHLEVVKAPYIWAGLTLPRLLS
jgi:hypothetical protein